MASPLTPESFDFEKLFTSPNAEPLPGDGPGDDRRDAALSAREQDYRKADDLNWLLEGSQSGKGESEAPEGDDEAGGLQGLAGAAAMDLGIGAVESPRQIAGGMRDAVQSLLDVGEIADQWRSLGGITFTDEVGNFSLDYKSGEEWRKLVEAKRVTEPDLPTIRAPTTLTGGSIRAITQFYAR